MAKIFPPFTDLRDAAFGTAGAVFDKLAVRIALDVMGRGKGQAQRSPEERLAELDRVAEAYSAPRYFTDPDTFFVPPSVPDVQEKFVRPLAGGGRVVDVSHPSTFEPVHPGAREKYLAHRENLTAHARTFLHPTPRPAIVCIHGYLGGLYAFEESAFSAQWLYSIGLDVALAVLPFHALRAPQGRRAVFPGNDPWRTTEGFAHAVHDLRALVRWLRARGSPAVGVFGMSLGGYTTSLLATAERGLDFAVPMIPLASLADVYFEHREGRADAVPEWVRPRIARAFRAVSPLTRPVQLPRERVFVLAARGDRITRITHAEAIWKHFGEPEMYVFPGGHLLQLGRRRAFGRLARFLAGLGLLAER